jgi:F-type H+-transporting ATPase subunit a
MLNFLPFASAGTGVPHIANWFTLIYKLLGAESPISKFIHHYEDLFFALIIAFFICTMVKLASTNPQRIPKGFQNFLEILVEGLNGFVISVMGPQGRKFTPLIGSLFLYIWVMNLAGLVPGFKSPTANLNTTVGLAVCVFITIQVTALRSFGIKGYISHMMGQPQNIGMALIGILIFSIEFLGEFVKPFSLSMRLSSNITGEDAFLAVAVGFGPMGVLLQLMAMGLGLILGTAQALVFATLSAVFISMVLPHEEHAEAHSAH